MFHYLVIVTQRWQRVCGYTTCTRLNNIKKDRHTYTAVNLSKVNIFLYRKDPPNCSSEKGQLVWAQELKRHKIDFIKVKQPLKVLKLYPALQITVTNYLHFWTRRNFRVTPLHQKTHRYLGIPSIRKHLKDVAVNQNENLLIKESLNCRVRRSRLVFITSENI